MVEFIGKPVSHFAYGRGIITAFYPCTRNTWVKFNDQEAKLYNLRDDMLSGTISTTDSEINNYIENLPSNKYSATAIGLQRTVNKDPGAIYKNCLDLLDDLRIPVQNTMSLTVNRKLKTTLARIKHSCFEPPKMEINQCTIADEVLDVELYNLLLHKLLSACQNYHYYALLVEEKCNYHIIHRDERTYASMMQVQKE